MGGELAGGKRGGGRQQWVLEWEGKTITGKRNKKIGKSETKREEKLVLISRRKSRVRKLNYGDKISDLFLYIKKHRMLLILSDFCTLGPITKYFANAQDLK